MNRLQHFPQKYDQIFMQNTLKSGGRGLQAFALGSFTSNLSKCSALSGIESK